VCRLSWLVPLTRPAHQRNTASMVNQVSSSTILRRAGWMIS
jgi:hypothetical protein